MAENWASAKKQALRVLGDKGKIPDDKATFKFLDALDKAVDAYTKSLADLEKKVADLNSQYSKFSDMIDKYEVKVEDDDLGLDKKDKDQAKKIEQAQRILQDSLNETHKNCQDDLMLWLKASQSVSQLQDIEAKLSLGLSG
jgi:predicted  nucleic acid-binding Zn-ribbon protein